MHLVCQVAWLKEEQGLEVYQPEREREVLRHVREIGSEESSRLGHEAMVFIFERIIEVSRIIEKKGKFERPEGTLFIPSGYAYDRTHLT